MNSCSFLSRLIPRRPLPCLFHFSGPLLLCAAVPALRAQTYDWNNTSGGAWSTAANWTPAGPPVAAGTARFNLASTYQVNFSAATTTASVLNITTGDVSFVPVGNTVQFPSTSGNGIGGILRANFGTLAFGNLSIAFNSGSTGSLYLEGVNTTTVGTGGFTVGTNGTGLVSIRGGSTLTTSNLAYLGTLATGSGTAVVNGAGSLWTANSNLAVGLSGSGTLNILNGGGVTSTALDLGQSAGSNGHLSVSGGGSFFTTAGNANLGGSSAANPAASAILDIGAGGTVNFNGNVNFRAPAIVNLSGGTLNLNTFSIAPGAAMNWSSGKVQFSSAAPVTGGVLDILLAGTHTLSTGHQLSAASGTLTLDTPLAINGGTLTAPVVNVQAPLGIGSFGTLNATDSVSIEAGKVLQVEEFGTLSSTNFIVNNGGLLQLNGATANVSGFTLNNFGTVQGTGRFTTGLNNGTGGTIRVRTGDHLIIQGFGSTSPGRIELSGGVLEYTKILSNLGSGIISGRGEFRGGTDNPGGSGLSNLGLIALSGGISDFHGDVLNTGSGHIITSGGAIVTFYDDLKHNGAEFKVSAASSVVCFGVVSGAGSFTGSGTFYMEGGYSPGNSPALVSVGTNMVLGDGNVLTLELGGHLPGSEYDQLLFENGGSLTAGGDLKIALLNGFVPAAGDSFQVLRFGSGQVSGSFDSISLEGTLAPGTWLDTGALLQTGIISVVPEPSSSFLGLACAFLFLRRSRSPCAPHFAAARARQSG